MIKKILLLAAILIPKNLLTFKIYVNSIPKCGTHLLTRCLELITHKKGIGFPTLKNNNIPTIKENEFFFCHIPFSYEFERKLKNKNFKVFFIYRDPRDQIVSAAYWIREKESRYKPYGLDKRPSVNELINLLIPHTNNTYNPFLPWSNSKLVCSIKFENLIGTKGQGNTKTQRNELKKICNFLNIQNPKINYYINNLFGNSSTFRKGQIGEWKNHFNEEQKNEFKKIGGSLLIELGYEKDFNW